MTSQTRPPDVLDGRSFDAVIFDLDQTLVDSARALAAAWATWLAEYQITPDNSRSFHGWTTEAIVRLCLPEDQVPAGLARIHELERTTTEGIRALGGATRALNALPPERVAIGTSGTQEVARVRLAAAGLTAPTVLVSASDVPHGKPAPDIFLRAASLLGVEPTRCLVVEDAPAGVAAARNAQMGVLAVLTTTPAEQLDAAAHVADLDDVDWHVAPDGIRVSRR